MRYCYYPYIADVEVEAQRDLGSVPRPQTPEWQSQDLNPGSLALQLRPSLVKCVCSRIHGICCDRNRHVNKQLQLSKNSNKIERSIRNMLQKWLCKKIRKGKEELAMWQEQDSIPSKKAYKFWSSSRLCRHYSMQYKTPQITSIWVGMDFVCRETLVKSWNVLVSSMCQFSLGLSFSPLSGVHEPAWTST